jgi:hypothetical protein
MSYEAGQMKSRDKRDEVTRRDGCLGKKLYTDTIQGEKMDALLLSSQVFTSLGGRL